MKIGFDIRPFLSGETGVGIYFKNLLHAIAGKDRTDTYYLLSSSFKERFPKNALPGFRKKKFRDLRIPVSILNFLWFRCNFPPMGSFFFRKLDLTHSPYPLIIPGGRKKIITVYDLSFIDTPDLVMKQAVKYFSPLIRRSIEKTDGIITISEFTRARIGEIFGKEAEKKCAVIYLGSDLDDIIETKPVFEVPDRFFLFTGTIEPRKNLTTLIKGFSIAMKKAGSPKLLLAGHAGEQSEEIKKLISDLRLKNEIIITGYMKRPELKYLYKNALALVFPSHYEGFGLPILEAASCGIPSIVSDIRVFREIYSDYPLYFEKSDPEHLAEILTNICLDKNLMNEKKRQAIEISRTFSWSRTADETLKFYDRVLK